MKRTPLEISGYWYWGLPFVVYLIPYVVNGLGLDNNILRGEQGAIELLTVLFLIVALLYWFPVFAGLYRMTTSMSSGNQLHRRSLITWCIIMLLGIVYFAGEELSWGQHLLAWDTPTEWSVVNDQRETNLHNTHAIFDQIPRLFLTVAIFIGGLLVPLYLRWRKLVLTSSSLAYWILPTWVCFPTALCLLLLKLVGLLVENRFLSLWLDVSTGELKEMLIALFIMMYMISLYKRKNV